MSNVLNKKMLTNCPNCGAPLSPDGYCSYCNTKVRYANEVEYNTLFSYGTIKEILPTEIMFKFKADDGTLIVIPFVGKPENVEIVYDERNIVDNTGNHIKTFFTSPTVRFDMVGYIGKEAL